MAGTRRDATMTGLERRARLERVLDAADEVERLVKDDKASRGWADRVRTVLAKLDWEIVRAGEKIDDVRQLAARYPAGDVPTPAGAKRRRGKFGRFEGEADEVEWVSPAETLAGAAARRAAESSVTDEEQLASARRALSSRSLPDDEAAIAARRRAQARDLPTSGAGPGVKLR